MRKGRFIALEGGEGSGKSTQARQLAIRLQEAGADVVQTREPGGTPGAEAIRQLLLDPPGEGWGARAEALLFAAARADHVERLIRPALESGKWVVCDRFIDSSRAYQGGAGGLGDEAIVALHRFGSEGLRPDLTILLDVPADVAENRLATRDGGVADAIGGRGERYHAAVARAFRSFAGQGEEDVTVVDADGSPEEVSARVWDRVAPLLDLVR